MGQRLMALRERAGLTQIDVAQQLHVRQATVSAWETGESEPRIFDAQKLCELYGTRLEAILPPQAPGFGALEST